MKIAICLSGYFRFYREMYSNYRRYLYEACQRYGEVDVFISTWDTLNSSSTFSARQGDTPIDCGQFDWEDILRTFQPKAAIHEAFDPVRNLFNVLNYDKTIDLSTLNRNIHDNGVLFGLAMFYRRYHCNELKRREEKRTGKQYDIVIQMRPDVFFLKPLDLVGFDPAKLYSRTFYNDHLLISGSANIDKISSLHLEVGRIAQQYGAQRPLWFDTYCPEYFLEHFLKEIGFDVATNRVEIGEDSMWVYPRRHFIATIYYILQKYGRLAEMGTLLDNPNGYLS